MATKRIILAGGCFWGVEGYFSAAVPVEGSVMLMATEKGFSLRRATKPGVPSQDLWGVVTWLIKRP